MVPLTFVLQGALIMYWGLEPQVLQAEGPPASTPVQLPPSTSDSGEGSCSTSSGLPA